MNINMRDFNKQVRQIADEEGWDIFESYNDKRARSRRLAYCRNGWPVPNDMKRKIQKRVQALVDTTDGIEGEVEWIESVRGGYGSYDKLIINNVPL